MDTRLRAAAAEEAQPPQGAAVAPAEGAPGNTRGSEPAPELEAEPEPEPKPEEAEPEPEPEELELEREPVGPEPEPEEPAAPEPEPEPEPSIEPEPEPHSEQQSLLPAAAAAAQSNGLCALAVRGHPNAVYNVVFKPGKAHDGFPQYETADHHQLHLFRHAQSRRWVFSFSTEEKDLEKPATILAPDGPVPVGKHTWRRQGESVSISVDVLAAVPEAEARATEVETRILALQAEKAAVAQAAKDRAHAQLSHTAAVNVQGMPASFPEYNGVYLTAGEHEGWVHFESEQGIHLYHYVPTQRWYLNHAFTPEKAQINAAFFDSRRSDCLLPVGEQAWTVYDGGWKKDQMLTITLLATEAEVTEQTEQLRLWRTQLEAAAKATAHAQLADIRAVSFEGLPASLLEYTGVYLAAGEHEGWLRFESAQGRHLYRCIAKRRWYLMDKFTPDSSSRDAYIEAGGGLLPVGEQEWEVYGESGWQDQSLTVALLASEAEVGEQTEGLGVLRECLLAERAAAVAAAEDAKLHVAALPAGWVANEFRGNGNM